jgi:tetratricopeptide (TPR) repeat protein
MKKLLVLSLLLGTSLLAAAPKVPLFSGIGPHARAVTTSSADAQRYFNQGLAFLYAFNHDEAIRSFQAATELDPACAMAWWGIATAAGPHINFPLVPEPRAKLAWDALQHAQRHAAAGTPVEQALIAAAAKRYAAPPVADRAPLDLAYADAMREVWRKFPSDTDVGALFAEAMMDLRPWDLWTQDTREAQPGTAEVVATLERVLELDRNHPLALHLYIHAVEASKHPGKARDVSDRLRDLMPGVGHMVHMPSHIDVLLGRWHDAVKANDKAIAADLAYRAQGGVPKGFIWLYNAHNRHMLAFAAMMTGQRDLALQHINAMVAEWPADFIADYGPVVDFFYAAPVEVMVRFGLWDEILARPLPPENLPISRALAYAARGIAQAAKGDTAAARAEQKLFLAARAKVAEDAAFGNNVGRNVLAVAEPMLDGEILFREGRTDAGLQRLRDAVAAEAKLRYDEPPDWIIPVRHALGASLLQVGRVQEAEQVYRDDLARWPGNGWSLFGLSRALKLQHREAEAAEVEQQFRQVWAKADLELKSSCLCQPGV